MPKSVFFGNHQYVGEQRLYDDLTVEFIKIHGEDFYYLPRTLDNVDPVFMEDSSSSFDSSYLVAMYIKDSEFGFSGGDFMSAFSSGPPLVTDSWTLVIAKKEFDDEVGSQIGVPRPMEGDLIYFPFNKKVYQINFVEHESVFYQLGQLVVFEMKCTIFKYSGEKFNTGIPEVDGIVKGYDINLIDNAIDTESGDVILDELEGLPITPEPSSNTVDSNIGAENDYYQRSANDIIDWTERDPFANSERY